MGRRKGSKNIVKTVAVKVAVKPAKIQKQVHPIRIAANFLSENAGKLTKEYWEKEARKRSLSLSDMIALFLIKDFGLEVLLSDI